MKETFKKAAPNAWPGGSREAGLLLDDVSACASAVQRHRERQLLHVNAEVADPRALGLVWVGH